MHAYLYWSNPPYTGRLITSNLGKWLIKIVRTHGAIVWVWGDRKWMFKTITVTHILQGHKISRKISLKFCYKTKKERKKREKSIRIMDHETFFLYLITAFCVCKENFALWKILRASFSLNMAASLFKSMMKIFE